NAASTVLLLRQPVALSDWLAELRQHGHIEPGQIVNTSLAGDPTTLADFNSALQREAFTGSFPRPWLGSLALPEATRQAWLDAALAAALPGVQRAAAWLDAVRAALPEGSQAADWITLDAATASLADPSTWPADDALLRALLGQGGTVRRS